MNTKHHKQLIDPAAYIMNWVGHLPEHITYVPKLKGDYRIIRQSSHDGTLLFVDELIKTTLLPIMNMQSYFGPDDPFSKEKKIKHIYYEVGDMRLITVLGKVTVGCGEIFGQKNRTSMPVKCRYIYEK